MADNSNFDFGKFVPGFDFLQNVAKGASQALPQMPNLSNWIAPTLNVEELEKRIGELKAVQFWLDQNAKALAATVQALEVQKMTLATLKGMNFNMGDVANAFRLKAADTALGAARKPAPGTAAQESHGKPAANAVVDPLQWWGALTQQFQQIATHAMKDAAAQSSAMGTAKHVAAGVAKDAGKGARSAARKAPAKKARKSSKAKKAH
jgi:hypothetical protein